MAGPVVDVPEAVLTSSADFFFDGASAAPGSFCALSAFSCAADLDIAFKSTVTDLMFQVSGFDPGDFVALGIFDAVDNLLATVNLTSNIVNLDLSSYGEISRLFFDDRSSGAGFAYSDFSFNQIPLPASLPLLAGGIALLAAARRRKA